MLTVQDYERIRQAYYVEQKSIRQIGRETGHGYWTVRKALENSAPQPYTLSAAKEAPKLGAYKDQIEALLAVLKTDLQAANRISCEEIY